MAWDTGRAVNAEPASLGQIIAWARTLPGITSDAPVGRGAVFGCDDRWVFECQPDGERWCLAAQVAGETVGWRFDTVADLERARGALAAVAAEQTARLTVHRLVPGRCYVVRDAFLDHRGARFAPGARLTFREQHFLPHDGGHTLVFEEATVYLQEQDEAAILEALDRHLEELGAD